MIKFLVALSILFSVSAFAQPPRFVKPDPFTTENYVTPDYTKTKALYAKAVADYNAHQPDAKLFMDMLKMSWSSAHPKLPIDAYAECMLFQFGGIEPIEHVQLSKWDEELNDTEERAKAFVASWGPKYQLTAVKLKYWLKVYAVSCDSQLNGRPNPIDLP